MIITDLKWKNSKKEDKQGYYLDSFLAEQMGIIPTLLEKDWNVRGIISSHGQVRMGKKVIATQIGYYISWMLAGGKMDLNKDSKNYGKVIKKPTKPVKFSKDNIVSSMDELKIKSKKLPKNSVIICKDMEIWDDVEKVIRMDNKDNKYGHILLVTVPNFFELSEDLATLDSLFLIDLYADKDYNRGFFNFYSAKQKEKLYILGKKIIGITNKYDSVSASLKGKFTKFMPLEI